MHPDLNYHLVDKPFAKKYFDENKFKGTFFVKDLSSSFDTHELLPKYDLVIANDFIEHVFNPHIIVSTIHRLTNPDSVFFISNPNWRMAHQYVYRGLFDFDNFVYLLYTHMFELVGFYGSELKTLEYPRISSESLLPDEHLTDWNHYLVFKHRS
jgi:SAM-dependent methyltransferase